MDYTALGRYQAALEAANVANIQRQSAANALRALLEDGFRGQFSGEPARDAQGLPIAYTSRHDFAKMLTALSDIRKFDKALRKAIAEASEAAGKAQKPRLVMEEPARATARPLPDAVARVASAPGAVFTQPSLDKPALRVLPGEIGKGVGDA